MNLQDSLCYTNVQQLTKEYRITDKGQTYKKERIKTLQTIP